MKFAQHFSRPGKSLENRGQVTMVKSLEFFTKLGASSPIWASEASYVVVVWLQTGLDSTQSCYHYLLLLLVITKGTECRRQHGRSKRFSYNAVLCVSFMSQMVKTCVVRVQGVECRNARDQIAFCVFHSFLVEVQTKAGYIHATHAQ